MINYDTDTSTKKGNLNMTHLSGWLFMYGRKILSKNSFFEPGSVYLVTLELLTTWLGSFRGPNFAEFSHYFV
jgi:hypothetical protein